MKGECELCGKFALLTKANIEGVEMEICFKCAGKQEPRQELIKVKAKNFITRKKINEEMLFPREKITKELIEGFGEKIKKARQKKGLKTKELARKLLITENDLKRIEQEKQWPKDNRIKKIENILGIKITKENS